MKERPSCVGHTTMAGATAKFLRETRAIAPGNLETMKRFTLQWALSLRDFALELEAYEREQRSGETPP